MFKNLSINKWIFIESTESTNIQLSKLHFLKKSHTNILLYTYRQTQGIGQFGSKWFTGQDENLAMSYHFKIENLKISHQFQLHYFFSLFVTNWISDTLKLENVKIKWPNDIYINDEKAAGILIQNTIQKDQISETIFGIGINVNTTKFPDNIPNPTSLKLNSSEDYDLNSLLRSFTLQLQKKIAGWTEMKTHALKGMYEKQLYGLEEERRFIKNDGSEFEGKITGVDDQGLLMIDTNEGKQKFRLKEIKYLL